MTIYDKIKELEVSLNIMIKCGIIKADTKRHIFIYEYLHSEMNKGIGRMQSYTNTADACCTSEANVRKIFEKYSKKLN